MKLAANARPYEPARPAVSLKESLLQGQVSFLQNKCMTNGSAFSSDHGVSQVEPPYQYFIRHFTMTEATPFSV